MNVAIRKVEFRFIFNRIKQNEMLTSYEKLNLLIISDVFVFASIPAIEITEYEKKMVEFNEWYL